MLVKGPRKDRAGFANPFLIDQNAYLVTPALVSPTRNRRSRRETFVGTIKIVHFCKFFAPDGSQAGRAELPELTEPAEVPEPTELAELSGPRELKRGKTQ